MQRRIETKCKIVRFLTSLACILFGMFTILNMNSIKSTVVSDVIPFVHSQMSNERTEIININSKFTSILSEQAEIVDVVLFRFVREGTNEENMYKGQIGITALNRNGNNKVEDQLFKISSHNKIFQEILLNKVHYENITSIKSECEEFYNSRESFTCKRSPNVDIAYKTVVTIPISDKDGYSVIGYILLTLNREYDNSQIAQVVSSIQPHITEVQESMLKF